MAYNTRNSSLDEIPERDLFIYDDIVHVLENAKERRKTKQLSSR